MDKRRTDTKEKIANQAIREIEKSGYYKFSIRDITQKLGVSSSTFYNHFDSKEALLDEVLSSVSKKAFDNYEKRFKKNYHGQTSEDALVFFTNDIMNQFLVHKNLMTFLFFSPSAIKEFKSLHSFNSSKQLLLGESYRLLKNFKEENKLKMDIKALHIKCWAFFQGYIMLASSNITEYKDDYIRDYLRDIICGDCNARTSED
jgi:AcrR family transcriptional regulator